MVSSQHKINCFRTFFKVDTNGKDKMEIAEIGFSGDLKADLIKD